MIQREEIECLRRIAGGDHDAFRSIFMKYYPKMKYFIFNIVKSEAIAEELSQDIFLKIWENKEKLCKIHSFNAYIYRIAKNTALNYLEHKYVEDSYFSNYKQATIINPNDELDAKELEFLVQLAVKKMPEQRRKIYIMSRVENLEKEEIAERLCLSKKTVENQLSLALQGIRKALLYTGLFFLYVVFLTI